MVTKNSTWGPDKAPAMMVAPLSRGAASILRSRVHDRQHRWWTIIKLEGEPVGDILTYLLGLCLESDGQIEFLR